MRLHSGQLIVWKGYYKPAITISPGGQERSFTQSPAKITGLSNGSSYSFTIKAKNDNGESDAVTSNEVTPQATSSTRTIDKKAEVQEQEVSRQT